MIPQHLRRGRLIASLAAPAALVGVSLVGVSSAAAAPATSTPTITVAKKTLFVGTPARTLAANQPTVDGQQQCATSFHNIPSNDYSSTATIGGHNALMGLQFFIVNANQTALATHAAYDSTVALQLADGTLVSSVTWKVKESAGPAICQDIPPKCKTVNVSTPNAQWLTVDVTKYCTDPDGNSSKIVLSGAPSRPSYGGSGTTRNAAGKLLVTYYNSYCVSGAKDLFYFDVLDDQGVDSGSYPIYVTITAPLSPPQFPLYKCGS